MEDFGSNIREWTQNELEIKKLQLKINDYKYKNKKLTDNLLSHIEITNQEDHIFKISSLNTDIKLNKTKISDSLTFKLLEFCLPLYFKENFDKSNDYHIQNIISFIKNKRTTKIKKNLEIVQMK